MSTFACPPPHDYDDASLWHISLSDGFPLPTNQWTFGWANRDSQQLTLPCADCLYSKKQGRDLSISSWHSISRVLTIVLVIVEAIASVLAGLHKHLSCKIDYSAYFTGLSFLIPSANRIFTIYLSCYSRKFPNLQTENHAMLPVSSTSSLEPSRSISISLADHYRKGCN